MFEPTNDQLIEERDELAEHERRCYELIGLIEDGNQELDMSSDMATITIAILGTLSDTIGRQIDATALLIEADKNKALDRFRRRQID